jgi:hypothetical protein
MAESTRVADEMVKIARADPARLSALQADPLDELEKLRAEAVQRAIYQGDRLVYRIAVIVLGSLALIAAIGSIVLVAYGQDTPEAVVALGSAAVGALVGLFAPSPSGE